jgi:hypothetical protein
LYESNLTLARLAMLPFFRIAWRYYYLVVFAVKTPLPFLALLVIGLAFSLSKSNRARAAY